MTEGTIFVRPVQHGGCDLLIKVSPDTPNAVKMLLEEARKTRCSCMCLDGITPLNTSAFVEIPEYRGFSV